MDFDALMAQARANEEQVKKVKTKKPLNLEPSRPTQKVRADLVRRQEEERRKKLADEERLGRQEREKLARMEAEMADHERKLREEQEKQDILDHMHREALERKSKMEAELQAKRDAVRLELERKREEERERKREARNAKNGDFVRDEDIFKRRQRELEEKERRREQRKKDGNIWKRREEHKQRQTERDKEKLMAKIREDAKKVAMSLSRGSQGSSKTSDHLKIAAKKKKQLGSSTSGRLLDIEQSAYLQRKRVESSTSSEEEGAPRRPPHRRRTSSASHTDSTPRSKKPSEQSVVEGRRSVGDKGEEGRREKVERGDRDGAGTSADKPKVSDILGGNVDTAALYKALNQFIKFPSGPTEDISEAEYDSHEDQRDCPLQTLAPLYKPTSLSTSEPQYSPLDSVFSETLTSQTLYNPTLNCRPSDSLFRESLISETTYSPRNLQGDATPCLSYSPSAIPTKYSPENFSDMKTNIEYVPSSVIEAPLESLSYTPGPSRYLQVDYMPTHETLTSETQNIEYSPALCAAAGTQNIDYSPALCAAAEPQNIEYLPALGAVAENMSDYSPAPVVVSMYSEIIGYSAYPDIIGTVSSEQAVSEGFTSPCTLLSETVRSPMPQRSESPATLQSETVYTSANLYSETFTSPATSHPQSATGGRVEQTYSPENIQSETLVSETVNSSPSNFVLSPTKITPSLDNFCYSPLKTDEIEQLQHSPKQNSEPADQANQTETLESETKYSPEKVETETSYSPLKNHPADSQYSPGPAESNIHYSPCPQYIPEHLSNEVHQVCYTPARPIVTGGQSIIEMTPNETEMHCEMTPNQNEVEMTPHETEIDCGVPRKLSVTEMTPNETEIHCEMTPNETELHCEMTPNETEIHCEMTPNETEMTPNQTEVNYDQSESEEIESERENEAEVEERKSKKRKLSESSEEERPMSADTRKTAAKEEEQEKLQELFGDTDSDEDSRKEQSASENEKESDEEEESPVNISQDRRNKLKELSRKKNKYYSSDSLSDDKEHDNKHTDREEANTQTDKPKSFEELMAIADKRDEENRKVLEVKKQREQKLQQQKKEHEAKRREMQVDMERKRKEAELERERERRLLERKKAERNKNRIPKVTSTADHEKQQTNKHKDKQTNKHMDRKTDKHTNRQTDRPTDSKQSFKIPKSNGTSSEHPSKRRKLSAPIRPDPTGSFEELMKVAQQNSTQSTFGSSIRKPEDVVREQKKKEAEKQRELKQFLNYKPTVPLPPPKQRPPPSRPTSRPPPKADHSRGSKHDERGEDHRKNSKEQRDHGKEQRSSDKEQRSSDKEQRSSDKEREYRKMKEEKRRQEKPRKLHTNPYMDDDIDDFVVSDGEEIDYSKAIRSMFGYDKRKYREEDDDCSDMVADYRTIEREEARSSRLAKKEDAEELKKILAEEERERKRKIMRR